MKEWFWTPAQLLGCLLLDLAVPETVGGYLSFALRAVLVYRAQDAYSTHGDISSPPAVLTERAKNLVQSRETLPDFAETAGPLTTSRQWSSNKGSLLPTH